ncbi:HAMP domain-containing histidine kinase [Altererythrobacter sp. BO-6]|uniref:sensor histidine kinase n=1 Tax=Altererythrobacter sp. BO-6 TaxID=2604537 RepID=UPI0013E11743|nr:HAMP domain-containing sensor histidine kinase [Altererythrobacter sp. BO-6]QIG52872.1 HAMP domain-containing histidine kinase [Altererythrobacter sp. BO-6]
MVAPNALLAARGMTDGDDRLVTADQPLAELQQRCGGQVPGRLAVPELLVLVRHARHLGLRLAREFAARDGEGQISGFVRINPVQPERGEGCEILIENWRREGLGSEDDRDAAERQDAIDRATAEFTARLDSKQRLLAAEGIAADLAQLIAETRQHAGKPWVEYVELVGISHRQPLHWRLLDGAKCRVPGSPRDWHARLIPLGIEAAMPRGFELLLIAAQASPLPARAGETKAPGGSNLIGAALMPALREPVGRIMANAETIRSRLAGPLREEYTAYAGDIVAAGKHLSALLDDLGDLEAVEAPGFNAAAEAIDLAQLARDAGGILSAKALEKRIELVVPADDVACAASGEARRVLQVLLNLGGNAINYSPVESRVELSVGAWRGGRPSISVRDQGPGLSREQQQRAFVKFERLGRSGDGGSGLGLYISRRLAEAMGGELVVESEQGKGACFTLVLPKQKPEA